MKNMQEKLQQESDTKEKNNRDHEREKNENLRKYEELAKIVADQKSEF